MSAYQRVIRIPLHWLVVGVMISLLSPVLAIVVSVHVNNNTIKANEAAKAEARREALIRYCRLLGSQVDVYAEATTQVGKDARAVWLREYQINGCQPPRK